MGFKVLRVSCWAFGRFFGRLLGYELTNARVPPALVTKDWHICIDTDILTYMHTDRQTDRQTCIHTCIHTCV